MLRGGKADAGVSTKIHDTDEKQRLRLLAERGGGENFGFIMRTEAAVFLMKKFAVNCLNLKHAMNV